MGKRDFLKGSLQNASYNIALQIMFRGVTFAMNMFVLRHLNQDVIGVMNVRLLLLEATILFLSREAFRRACVTRTMEHCWPQVINLIWLTLPICAVLSLFFGFIWLHILTVPDVMVTPHYYIGVWSIAIGCLMEMCCEPLYLVAQAYLFIRLKVVCESVLVGVRTLTFTLLVHQWASRGAVLAFSIAQVLSIGSYMLTLYAFFWWYLRERSIKKLDGRGGVSSNGGGRKSEAPLLERKQSQEEDFPFHSLRDFLPKRLESENQLDGNLLRLTWSFMKQGLLKQLLTDGERYVMTVFPLLTFSEQGTFDIVNNLGSLAARFLFRPIEESCYFYFSQVIKRDLSITEQNQTNMKEAADVLRQVLRCVTSLGLVVLVFGQSYSRLLLLLYGGSSLSDGGLAPLLLRSHCLAVLFLAVNGTVECYALATMDTHQIDRYNKTMVYLSVTFLSSNWLFTRLLGSVGFILANCCNMATRIFQSGQFIRLRYQGSGFDPLQGLIPGRLFSISLCVALVLTTLSEQYLYDSSKLYHFLLGTLCFLSVLACWIKDNEWLMARYTQWKHKAE